MTERLGYSNVFPLATCSVINTPLPAAGWAPSRADASSWLWVFSAGGWHGDFWQGGGSARCLPISIVPLCSGPAPHTSRGSPLRTVSSKPACPSDPVHKGECFPRIKNMNCSTNYYVKKKDLIIRELEERSESPV